MHLFRRVVCFVLLITLLCVPTIFADGETSATTLRIYPGPFEWHDGVEAFRQAHPEVTLEGVPNTEQVFNTSEFVGKLITREYDNDLFMVSSFTIDYRPIMEKGYCLDLSGSQALRDAVARMHPVIAQEAFQDGKLLGLPMCIFFDYLVIQPKGWEAAGYDSEDVPQSYPELLALLEEVCDRMEGGELENFRVYPSVASTQEEFTPMSYAGYFADWLLREFQLQCQLAEISPDFTDPELVELLERTVEVSRRLYDLESYMFGADGESQVEYSLIINGDQQNWPKAYENMLFLRLNASQPRAICSYIEMMMVYAGTEYPELAVEYLESLAPYGNSPEYAPALLYADAEPIVQHAYEVSINTYQQRIADCEALLAREDLTRDEREKGEADLAAAQAELEEYEAYGKYNVTQAQIDSLASHMDEIVFLQPGPLTAGTDMRLEYMRLFNRFVGEQLDARGFLEEVQELYRRIAQEDSV